MKFKLSLLSAAIFSTALFLSPTAVEAKLPVAVDGQSLPTLAPMLERVTPGVGSIRVSGA